MHRSFPPVNLQHPILVTSARPPPVHNTSQSQVASMPEAAYQEYIPTSNSQLSYSSCFERLGFKITASTELKRDTLLKQVNLHVDGSVYRFLRSTDNMAASQTMVFEFLAEHGLEYWGSTEREHLAEPDFSKGFLCPRDAHRERSSLVIALQGLFDYNAKFFVTKTNMKFGLDWTRRNVDYGAMTGRKADASALDTVLPGVQAGYTQRRPFLQALKGDNEVESKDEGKDTSDHRTPTGSWNVFDTVETETRLRPSPKVSHAWKRNVSADEGDGPSPIHRPKAKKRRVRMPAAHFPSKLNNAANTGKEVAGTATGKIPLHSGSDSEQPLSHKTRLPRPGPQPQPFTPPTSNAPSATPATSSRSLVIDLDPSPEGELFQKQHVNDAIRIKAEPLSPGDKARTMLLVSASNQPEKAPITVPFAACQTLEELFTTLIKEQGLRLGGMRKVDRLSATYTWNQKRRGIRRGNSDDWDRFCKAVRKAWESESNRFEDECEIEMVLHVDE